MIEIAKLKGSKGVLKYGTCSGCSKNSKDDPEMIRITLKQYSSGTSVCLCKECMKELLKRILIEEPSSYLSPIQELPTDWPIVREVTE